MTKNDTKLKFFNHIICRLKKYIDVKIIIYKEIESLSQTQKFKSLYLCNLMAKTFDISYLDSLIQQSS